MSGVQGRALAFTALHFLPSMATRAPATRSSCVPNTVHARQTCRRGCRVGLRKAAIVV